MRAPAGRLAGRAAIVTGAASGIGRAIAAGFAREGAIVGALDRSPVAFESGLEVAPVLADVTDETALTTAIDSFVERTGRLDVLVHSAGVQLVGEDSILDSLDADTWSRTLAINLTGAFLVSRAAVRAMLGGGGGSIILLGSPTGLRGTAPDYTAYSTTKGGVHALTRVIATAYGPMGIRANTLIPGATETGLTAEIFRDTSVRERLMGRTPLGRLAVPEDYVGAAIFLASDESSFATGAEFVIDGGYGAA